MEVKNFKVMEKKPLVYLIGSLRNEHVPDMALKIRELGFEVFDDWFSPGPEADEFWRKYEKKRGSTYKQALSNWAGKHVFEFDKYHIDRADIGILYMPAGKSGHLELGYMIGSGKKCIILFDKEPERWDVMYQFADSICFTFDELKEELNKLLALPVSPNFVVPTSDNLVEETNTGFLIKMGVHTAYFQRFTPLTASEDPLTDSEEVIIRLCEQMIDNKIN